jgi:predicted N-acetyltransferase YhbS
MISYRIGKDVDLDKVIDLYAACSLGERRPIDDRRRMNDMLRNANLVVTAWDADLMVGMARSLSDFAYITYLADLAVRESHQKLGIGKELIRITQRAGGPETSLVLLAAPQAGDYYPHVGFTRHDSAWVLRTEEKVR